MSPGEWQLHPRMTSRLVFYWLVRMPGGHELMFSNPKGLADKLIEAGRDQQPTILEHDAARATG
jgi:hypothetical protein